VVQLLGNRCCHGNDFQPQSLGGRLHVRYWVKAYFSCIHYVPVWPCTLTYFSPKLGHVTGRLWWTYLLIWKFIDVFFSEIWGHKCKFHEWGSKIALSHWQGPWLIQQLVLTYKPWCYTNTVAFANMPWDWKFPSGRRFSPHTDWLARIMYFSSRWLLCCEM